MAMTEHLLPVINNLAVGVAYCRLYHDSTITITYPPKVDFANLGDFVERIDAEGGVIDIDNVSLDIVEDCSTYPEGFWWKLINGYPTKDVQLMFTVMEGTDETFLIKGSIYRGNTDFSEVYINGTDRVRVLSTQLVSMLGALKNVTMTALRTEIITHIENLTDGAFIQMRSVIASMIALAFGETFSKDLVVNNSTDIQATTWGDYTTWIADWPDLYMFDTVNEYLYPSLGLGQEWTARFATAFDLLKHLSLHFGVIPRYSFGTADGLFDSVTSANNSHRLTFNSRGRAADTITLPVPLESDFVSDTTYKAKSIRATDTQDNKKNGWVLNSTEDTLNTTYNQNIEPLPFANFDMDLQIDWNTDSISNYVLYYLDVDTHCYQANVRYYNYSTKGYINLACVAGVNSWVKAIVNYLYYRFLVVKRFQYTRTYDTIKANNLTINSQRAIMTLAKHQITDIINGVSVTNDFYATEVYKNLMTGRLKVVWAQQ